MFCFMFCFMSHSIGWGIRSESLHVCNARSPLPVPISRHVSLSQPRAKINLRRLMAKTINLQHDAATAMAILVSSISAHNMQTVVVTPAAIILATNDVNLLWASRNGGERVNKRKMRGRLLFGEKLKTYI